MRTVLLAGGLGTRIREESEFKPKPMVQIGDFPLIWHLMKYYSVFGHKDFVICTGYKGEILRSYFRDFKTEMSDFTINLGKLSEISFHDDYEESDWSVTLANTGQSTMTGGRLYRARKYIKDDIFMCTYGDGLSNVNLNELIKFHKSHGKVATVTAVRPVSRFGVLDISEHGDVERFREKPQADGWINVGYFVFNKSIFNYLNDTCTLENDPMSELARDEQLMAFKHEGFWQPMDTYREFMILNDLWKSGEAPWKVW